MLKPQAQRALIDSLSRRYGDLLEQTRNLEFPHETRHERSITDAIDKLDPAAAPDPSPGGIKRFPGQRLLEFAQTPMGEEMLEGALMAGVTVLPQFFANEDPRENTLQLVLGALGGFGLGMGGRRIGARLGKRFHPDEIKNPGIRMMVGMGGQETMGKGIQSFSTSLARMSADMRAPEIARILQKHDPVRYADFSTAWQDAQVLEQKMRVDNAEESIAMYQAMKKENPEAAEAWRQLQKTATDTDPEEGEKMIAALTGDGDPITGEHAGRFLGRFFGDEIGVLTGVIGGGMIAQQLGWQSPKDKQISALQQQLKEARS
jgi:hypothetical protein